MFVKKGRSNHCSILVYCLMSSSFLRPTPPNSPLVEINVRTASDICRKDLASKLLPSTHFLSLLPLLMRSNTTISIDQQNYTATRNRLGNAWHTSKHNTSNSHHDKLVAEVSLGELVDKITILEIKLKKITNEEKKAHIKKELETLRQTYMQHISNPALVEPIKAKLLITNEELWNIEDEIRVKEQQKAFDDEFIKLARGVYVTNDKRFSLKNEINKALGSAICEVKQLPDYKPQA